MCQKRKKEETQKYNSLTERPVQSHTHTYSYIFKNHKSQITNHKLQITNHKSQITNHKSKITNHKSQTTITTTNHKSHTHTFTLCIRTCNV